MDCSSFPTNNRDAARPPSDGYVMSSVPRHLSNQNVRGKPRIVVGLLLLLCGVCLAGNDWPHQRGPSFTGWADGPAGDTPVTPVVAWSTSVGQGFSSFVIAGKRAVGQAQTWDAQFVVCLDIETGDVRWRRKYGRPWDVDGDYPGPYSTPTIADGHVFFAGCRGTLGCLRLDTGEWVWRARLEDIGVTYSGFGYAATPLVWNGRVYVPGGESGPAVVALDADTGQVEWTATDEAAGYCSCLPVRVGATSQIVSFLQNAVVGHDPTTGVELWRSPWSEGYDPHPAWPVYEESLLLCSAPFRRGARCMRLVQTNDAWHAETVWQRPVLSCDVLSPVVRQGCVYGFDLTSIQADGTGETEGTLRCVDLDTGTVRWQTDAVGHASVVGWGGYLILWTEGGELIIARAAPEAFREVVRRLLIEGALCWSTPAVAGHRLIVRGGEHVVCVRLAGDADEDARSASTLVQQRPRQSIQLSPERWRALVAGVILLALGRLATWRFPPAVGHLVVSLCAAAGWAFAAVKGHDGSVLLPVLLYSLAAAVGRARALPASWPGAARLAVRVLLGAAVLLAIGALFRLGWVLRSEILVALLVAMAPAMLLHRLLWTCPSRAVCALVDMIGFVALCALAFALAAL